MKKLLWLLALASLETMAACPAVNSTQTFHKILNVSQCGALSTGTTSANAETNRALIQAAIKNVSQYPAGGEVVIPAGTYYVGMLPGDGRGIYLELASKVVLRMQTEIKNSSGVVTTAGTTLKAFPTTAFNYRFIHILQISNAGIFGGTIIGDKNFPGRTRTNYQDFGMGIYVWNSTNITIQQVVIKDMWGDGIYIEQEPDYDGTTKDILIDSVTADNNSRNAISVISVDGIIISNSKLINTNGAEPQGGIDFEPDADTTFKTNGVVFNNTISGNSGIGISAGNYTGIPDIIQSVKLISNTITGNKKAGINLSEVSNVKVIKNIINNNLGDGIIIQSEDTTITSTTNNMLVSNTVNTNGGYGIALDEVLNNRIYNNSASGNVTGSGYYGNYQNLICKNSWQASTSIQQFPPFIKIYYNHITV